MYTFTNEKGLEKIAEAISKRLKEDKTKFKCPAMLGVHAKESNDAEDILATLKSYIERKKFSGLQRMGIELAPEKVFEPLIQAAMRSNIDIYSGRFQMIANKKKEIELLEKAVCNYKFERKFEILK